MAATSDARVDTPSIDAVIDAPAGRCSPTAVFAPPVKVPGMDLNTTALEYNAQLTPDERGIYFVRQPGSVGGADIYVSYRNTIDGEFAMPAIVAGVNSTADDVHPSVTEDGRTMYLTTNRAGGSADVYVATRTSLAGAFSTPTAVSPLNTTENERGTYILPDGNVIYFSRYTTATSEIIYRSELGPTGFAAPVVVPGLDTIPMRSIPVVSPDELTMYFTAQTDIWVARRASKDDAFQTPTLVSELASSASEEPSWISSDGCVLYFSSNRDATNSYDLFVARRGI